LTPGKIETSKEKQQRNVTSKMAKKLEENLKKPKAYSTKTKSCCSTALRSTRFSTKKKIITLKTAKPSTTSYVNCLKALTRFWNKVTSKN